MPYLVYILIILLPIEIRLIFNPIFQNGIDLEYDNISLYATDILIFLTALFFLKEKTLKIKFISLLPWLFLITLTLIPSVDKNLTIYYWFKIGITVLLILLIYYSRLNKVQIAYAFITSATLESLLAIFQFAHQIIYANKWMGIAAHDAFTRGDSVIAAMSNRLLRAYGTLPHPNILGGFLVIALIIAFWLLYQQKQNNPSNISYLYLLGCYYIILGTLFFTFSRSAWLTLIIIGSAWFYCFVRSKKSQKGQAEHTLSSDISRDPPSFPLKHNHRTKYIILSSLILISILSLIFSDFLLTRAFISNSQLENNSITERGYYIQQTMNIFLQHSLLGVGLGQYTNALQTTYPNNPIWSYQPVHNIYLLALTELGTLGIFILTLLTYRTLKKNSITIAKNKLFLSLVLGLMIVGLFDHYLWTLHFGLLLTGFVVGFSMVLQEHDY